MARTAPQNVELYICYTSKIDSSKNIRKDIFTFQDFYLKFMQLFFEKLTFKAIYEKYIGFELKVVSSLENFS